MDAWKHQFENHMKDAEMLVEEKDFRGAFQFFKDALSAIPEPQSDHGETTRAVMGIADCYYSLGQYQSAEQPLRDVLLLPGGAGNPYIQLRRGQVLHHLGDPAAASAEWASAYMNGGKEIFDGEEDCREAIEEIVSQMEANPQIGR